MRFALIGRRYEAVAFVAFVVALAHPAFADSAFISQAGGSVHFGRQSISPPVAGPSAAPSSFGATQPTPETAGRASGGNFAGTLEMGKSNSVLQAQNGAGNASNVGILKGIHDNVNVLQHGQGLVSNVLLVNAPGLSVDVIQPPGSAPVNMLIARLPNGTLDVIQPAGSTPVSLVSLPNGKVVLIKR
jgi:hypothetical protein